MLSARNIRNRRIQFDDYRLISDTDFALEHRRTDVSPGDVLLTIVGTVGRTAVVQCDQPVFALQRSVAVLKSTQAITPDFLSYSLESPSIQKYFEDNAKGTAQKGIYLRALAELNIPIAPLPEQKRIADKLEAVLGRVDACRTRLDRVPALLKRFRQSVLAAATSGKLTEEIDDPEKWESHQFGDMFLTARTGLDRRSAAQGDDRNHPYLKMNNMTSDGRLHLDGVTRVDASEEEAEKYSLKDGDFLFNTRNSVELVGKTCVFKSTGLEEPFLFNNNILRVRFKPRALPEYVNMWFCSPKGRDELEKLKSATTSVAAIYQSRLNELQLTLPPRHIQQEIVRRVEALFAFADRIEARLAAAQTTVGRLTPATLAKAFCGELVPQDPDDEPAAALLARFRGNQPSEHPKAKGLKRS